MSPNYHLALDLGAESGRLILGILADGKLDLQELHRFQNVPVRKEGSLHWNIRHLTLEVKEGLRKAAATRLPIESISTDSWGVDYILFDDSNAILEPVFHYRDPRAKLGVERALKKVDWEQIFAETGIQYMPINTLFQLAAEAPERLLKAKFLLGIGDAMNFFLSGVPRSEVSMASTFQLYNPKAKTWSEDLIRALGFPRTLFPEIVPSGVRLGPIRPELAAEIGIPSLGVIASCSHDTGAAVAGVPASGGHWAYLSSGTWSLMGVELPEPVITNKARELNFTNEIGYGNSVRLLKNLSGLWLVQEGRRAWARHGRNLDYANLTRMAAEAPPFCSLINPAAEEFLAPESMPDQIAAYCRRTGQPVPQGEGAFVRCALESLALLYRRTLFELQELTGEEIDRLHVVGGGSNNELLNQFTADALGIAVWAGPSEATAIGNILIQAMTLEHVESHQAAREIVRRSTPLRQYLPGEGKGWDDACARFDALCHD